MLVFYYAHSKLILIYYYLNRYLYTRLWLLVLLEPWSRHFVLILFVLVLSVLNRRFVFITSSFLYRALSFKSCRTLRDPWHLFYAHLNRFHRFTVLSLIDPFVSFIYLLYTMTVEVTSCQNSSLNNFIDFWIEFLVT